MSSLEYDWERFLINENLEKDVFMYIQSLQEFITHLKPKSLAEQRRAAVATQHIKEARRYARRMQNRIDLLQEKLTILEESLNENEDK